MNQLMTLMPTIKRKKAVKRIVPPCQVIRRVRAQKDEIDIPISEKNKTRISPSRRDAIIMEFLPLVKYIAGRIANRLPRHIELDDLTSSGIIGLIDAIEKYDSSRRIKFRTYAEFRIKGAILDELRARDWVPRSIRKKSSQLEKAYVELEQKLGRAADDSEMIEFMKISREQFYTLIKDTREVSLISLDELQCDADSLSSHNLLDHLADNESLSPSEILDLDQIYRIVADTIDRLPEKERIVISLYYYDEMVMKEIGEILSITESRVSQIHTKAILRLRGRLLLAIGCQV